MSRRGLARLEACWRAVHQSPQPFTKSLSFCRLHETQHEQCRHSSFIVKSPFKDIQIPNSLIHEVVWETVDKFPEATAIKCGQTGRAFTYAEVHKLSQRFATSLRKAGFSKGDVLALILPNSPEFAIIILGALQADLAVSLLNHSYTADEMCHQLKDSGSVCVVSATEKLNTVLSAIDKVENSSKTKPFRMVVAVDTPSPDSLPGGVRRFSEMVCDGIERFKSNATSQPDDLAFLPYSSGTTGLSKGVCLSHRNILCNVEQFCCEDSLKMRSPLTEQDIMLGLLPFYHIYGLTVILLSGLNQGAQIVTLPKFEQDTLVKTLNNEKMSVMMLVPPLVLFLGSSSKVTPASLAHIRAVFSGAAPLGASDMEKMKMKLPSEEKCFLSQAYGMTELSPVVTMPMPPCKNLATVGVPIPNTFGKIINPETGEALGPNQSGELCFKGPQVMLGYHNNPKATADMIDAEGWLKTGDIGYYDKDDNFYVQDRLKELIKVKGFQVPPAELEEVLRAHPLVSDVGVIGVPCPRAGEVPVAYIVPQKDKKLTVDDVKAYLSEKVSRHKQVGDVIFTDTIPKSAAGKILRKDLRQLYKSTH